MPHFSSAASPDASDHRLARDVLTDDADCLAQSISGWSQEYQQLTAGRFQGRLSEICLGGAQIFLEQTSHALRQDCLVPPGHVWFGLPHSTARSVRINGASVDSGRIALHRGGENFELVTPEHLQFWGIVVPQDVLATYARQFECEERFTRMLGHPVLGVRDEIKRSVQQIAADILQTPGLAEGHGVPQTLHRSLSDTALSALFSLFGSLEPVKEQRISGRQRHRLVERADAYVREHSDRMVTVAELCTALSSSRRALQTSFQDELGVSPHAYIRAVSLNRVRAHLKNPESPYASVQDAAAAFGFWHMSQFAADYRQLFGELPSATIRRRGGN